jgi:endonuclease/exonuclease/phosphatase family metal-dependent hydrolase
MAERARSGMASEAWAVPVVALGVVVLFDVMRVWLPSVIFVYGRAGSTPATTMGAFALAWFLAGVVLAALTGRLGPWRVLAATGLVLAASRLVLQGGPGGTLQLYAASIGVLAAIGWLSALTATDVSRRLLATGLAVGLAGDVTLRTALWTVELTWVHGIGAAVAAVVLVGAFAVASLRLMTGRLTGPATTRASAWPWLLVGPVLLLFGVLSGLPSRALIATDWPVWFLAALFVAASGIAVTLPLYAPLVSGPALGIEAAVLTLVGTWLALPADGPLSVLGQVLLASGIAAALGVAAGVPGDRSPTRRAVVTSLGMLLFFVLAFLYYAAYDLSIGIPNQSLLLVGAVIVAALALVAGTRRRTRDPAPGSPLGFGALAGATAAAMLLAAVGAGVTTATPEPAAGDGFPVRIMTYNVHMGYDTAGRFDVRALAEVITSTGAEVVVLNEVDRGWFLNGGHDVLALLAAETGLAYAWTPAADEVWGNAILSRYPIADTRSTLLPQGDVPMRRSLLTAVLDLGADERLAVVGTHLHHVDGEGPVRLPQAQAVAEEAADLVGSGFPTVVLGDMNAEPGEPELAPFEAVGLTEAVSGLGEVLTFPSWGPDEHIDHIFTGPGLSASELDVPASQASDHLGVAVTLSLTD